MGSSYSPIPIINRMTEVLNEILGTSSGLTATELMKRLDIPKTTLYRLLASLCDNNFLQYNEHNSKYTMGRKFSYVYSRFNEKYNAIKRASHIHLQELANRIGAHCFLLWLRRFSTNGIDKSPKPQHAGNTRCYNGIWQIQKRGVY